MNNTYTDGHGLGISQRKACSANNHPASHSHCMYTAVVKERKQNKQERLIDEDMVLVHHWSLHRAYL